MSLEFIGHVFPHEFSETIAASGPVVQPDYLRALARAHEAAGFDKVLIPHSSSMADGFILADQARDGHWLDKAARYRRSGEFLEVVKREWSEAEHFDHEGEFYRVKDAWSSVRPIDGHIPVYFGGAPADAVRVAAEHADVYALWGEPLAGVRERIAQVQAAAAEHGRSLRFSVSLRPIVAATEEAAWERAREISRVTEERAGAFTKGFPTQRNEGSERLLKFAADREVHDDRLFTAPAKATGAAGNSTALVGTPAQVADALLAYVDAGASTLLIRGYEPYNDAVAYGEVISLVRERALVAA